jgi:hypothetical protein
VAHPRTAAARIGLTACLVLAGCGGARRDAHPMSFGSPSAGATHGLPLELRWTAQAGAAGYAVFVDRPPVAPGARVQAAAIDLLHSAGPSVVLSRLAGVSASRTTDHHLVAVVVDAGGRRLGERAAVLDVRIDPLAVDVPDGSR